MNELVRLAVEDTEPPPNLSLLVRLSLASAIFGVLVILPLLIKETAYTLLAFMFLGQPLLLLSVGLFTWRIFQDFAPRRS
jgi:hypothetical protein